jgi:perosamine synthetase
MREGKAVIDDVLRAVREVVPAERGKVGLHEPTFAGRESEYVLDCLKTGWVSSVGAYVDRFEAMLAEYTGVKCAVATVNGTAALHVALLLAGVEAGDEVLMPTLTFIATANAVSYCGAVPHFVDIEEERLGIDPAALAEHLGRIAVRRGERWHNRETGSRLGAVLPMHTFGHPVDIAGLQEVCKDYGLVIVEDAAESLGASYRGVHTGGFGRVAALSFNGNKIITTGGGGAILTNDVVLGRRAKHLTTTARVAHRWAVMHDEVGYNYRLPNLNAALGCAQMERLPTMLEQKRALAARYIAAFGGVDGVRFVAEPADSRSNYWLNTILLAPGNAGQRDALLQALNDVGLMARPSWTLMHHLPMYTRCPKAPLPVAEAIERRLLNLPSSPFLA